MSSASGEEVWDDLDDDIGQDGPAQPPRAGMPRRAAVAFAAVAIVGGVWMARSGQDPSGELPIERATAPEPAEEVDTVTPPELRSRAAFQTLEEARILLALAAAEIVAVRDLAEQADAPPQRLRILADQTAGHLARITRFRVEAEAERTSAGELAAAYRDHVDHESLVRNLLLVESRARDLALLDAVHYTAVRDISVIDLHQARPELERRLVMALFTPTAAAWAEALLAHLDGAAVDTEAARTAALQEWSGITAQVGGMPAPEQLSAYVEGLDVEVVRTLRRERYFDGVLRYLVDRGVDVPDIAAPTQR